VVWVVGIIVGWAGGGAGRAGAATVAGDVHHGCFVLLLGGGRGGRRGGADAFSSLEKNRKVWINPRLVNTYQSED
jgi:hypothetical protein